MPSASLDYSRGINMRTFRLQDYGATMFERWVSGAPYGERAVTLYDDVL